MTDGPHKSLPMPPRWKKVAKYADTVAFEQNDVDAALHRALKTDYGHLPEAVLAGIREVMEDPNDTIFRDHKIQKLEAFRSEAAGPALLSTLIDCGIQHLQQDAPGPNAFQAAVADALITTAASQARAMEEHYHRKVGRARARDLRSRLESAIGVGPCQALAREVTGNKGKKTTSRAHRSGLDDGVSLR